MAAANRGLLCVLAVYGALYCQTRRMVKRVNNLINAQKQACTHRNVL